ncbi:hypothetical protein IFM89_027388 [Coptis chinensis]|uniref:NADH dehydrogenase [ubiquinone] 1 alpha subcomplex subunit 12 n=1 Tax=Coptis chinensis TaxID=261450 RepID=A0A835LIV5_9MAGN|nr:hypothetical protein IFM89_027388 [Coptis chinensis]
MSKLFSRIAGLFSSKTFAGVDKAGNKYFTRKHDIDGNLKEKRWVIFKGEEDPTSVPVEWICWLNGQRKIAPTPEADSNFQEMAELEARRERVKLNVALLKKEEEEKKAKVGSSRQRMRTGKVGGPDLKSFIQQYPTASSKDLYDQYLIVVFLVHMQGDGQEEGVVDGSTGRYRNSIQTEEEKLTTEYPESLEPTGSGASFKPGTWQPPV